MDSPHSSSSRLDLFLKKPFSAILSLAVPIMLGMGIHTFYNLADMYFIGKLGGQEIAAIAFNMPIFFLILGLTMGLGSGVTASVARYIGQKDKIKADHCAEHAIIIAYFISITFTALGLIFGKSILIFLGAKDFILIQAWDYLFYITLGLPFMVFSAFFRSVLAGEGDMKFPMIVAGLGTILNIILDPIFIFDLKDYGGFGLNLGVKGAALATVVSQLFTFTIFVFMLFVKKYSYITYNIKKFKPSKLIFMNIVKVGVPASLSMVIMALGQAVFNKILIFYSPQTVAAYQVAGRIDMLIFLPIFAIAGAMTTLVGMFYGANKIKELIYIVKYGLVSSFIVTIFSSAVIYKFAHKLSSFFTNDRQVIDVSVGFLQLLCFIYPFIAIAITSGRIMQGLGKGIPVLFITLVRVVVISAPLGLYFTYTLNKPVEWNWYAMMISAILAFILAISWVRYELKKINLNKERIAV
tara:strand:+ start:340 stop:1740 length:1401 start_codon:yes stop_codon:yes gene_type:complete